jgi:HAE1 family hydrophobic/amphiphilic exporter-1
LDNPAYEPPAYADAVAVALVNRPELNDLEHRAGVAKELVKIAKAGDKPRLDFNASYARKRYDFPEVDMDTSGKSWSAGIYLSFPVFDGRATKGRVMQARSDQTRLDIQTEKLKDAIGVEVQVALDSVEEAAEIMKALSGTVQEAERLRAMSEKGYEYGVKTRLDVEEAQLYVRQSKGNLAAAKRDFLVAQTNLLWVQGVLGER